MKATILLIAAILLPVLSGCEANDASPPSEEGRPEVTPMDRLPDDEAGQIVRRAIERAGGWEAWQNARTLDYQKTIIYYDSLGHEDRRLNQHHQYQMQPTQKMRIEYEDFEGRQIRLVNDGDEAVKWIDGERVTSESDRNHAWNSTFGSHYVMSMPFKLTDPGVSLSYAGKDTLDGTVVDAVRVDYEEGAGSAGGLHTWTYYFAHDDGRLVANHLRYGPEPEDYDLTEYVEIRPIEGVHWSIRRASYHSNAQYEKLAQTSAYVNDEVRVNAPLPDSLFALSPAG